jgi:hypothetical protein
VKGGKLGQPERRPCNESFLCTRDGRAARAFRRSGSCGCNLPDPVVSCVRRHCVHSNSGSVRNGCALLPTQAVCAISEAAVVLLLARLLPDDVRCCLSLTDDKEGSYAFALRGCADRPTDLPRRANQIRTFGLRQINPTGKSPKVCLAPREKILRFCRRQISARTPAIPSHKRGDRASSRTRGGMRWT